jgi:hypothetical protein
MSIERKDRSFDKIFEEVTFDRIPMDYVLYVKVHLNDGTIMTVSPEDLSSTSTELDILGDISREDVLDISFSLDFESIKEDIGLTVDDVFEKMFGPAKALISLSSKVDMKDTPDNNPDIPPTSLE